MLLADGATGTNLFLMDLLGGEAPELLNERTPETIVALHQGFVDAGADIILTNSFGGTRNRLKISHDRLSREKRKTYQPCTAPVWKAAGEWRSGHRGRYRRSLILSFGDLSPIVTILRRAASIYDLKCRWSGF